MNAKTHECAARYSSASFFSNMDTLTYRQDEDRRHEIKNRCDKHIDKMRIGDMRSSTDVTNILTK